MLIDSTVVFTRRFWITLKSFDNASQVMFPIPSLRSGNEALGSQPSFLAIRAPREIPLRMKASTRANTTLQQVQFSILVRAVNQQNYLRLPTEVSSFLRT